MYEGGCEVLLLTHNGREHGSGFCTSGDGVMGIVMDRGDKWVKKGM